MRFNENFYVLADFFASSSSIQVYEWHRNAPGTKYRLSSKPRINESRIPN